MPLPILKNGTFFLGNINAGTGTGVAPDACLALADGKGAEATKLNPIASFQRATDLIKNRTDKTFDITVVQRRVLSCQPGDEFRTCHRPHPR